MSSSSSPPFPPYPSSATASTPTRRRPWPEFVRSINRPYTLNEAKTRIKENLAYFLVNYTYIILFAIFASLLWHPVSLIIFLVIFAAWFFLYFFRDSPLVVFNRVVDDRIVVGLLGVVTVLGLVFSGGGVWVNVLVSGVVGGVVVLVHAVLRRSDDLYSADGDGDGDGGSGLRSFVGYSRV